MKPLIRCAWARTPLDQAYHDTEWGVPLHDDQKLFEFLVLEGAQAGLSWATILARRDNYRRAFDGFDVEKVARYSAKKQAQLLSDPGIIRNRLKINSAIKNARAFLAIQEEFGSFDKYIWQFVNYKSVVNHFREHRQIPTSTPAAHAMSADLRRRGFNFVGPTICYAHMQATGMVNDHLISCFRHSQCGG